MVYLLSPVHRVGDPLRAEHTDLPLRKIKIIRQTDTQKPSHNHLGVLAPWGPGEPPSNGTSEGERRGITRFDLCGKQMHFLVRSEE